MLHEAFGEQSLSRTAVLNGIHISRPVKCQLKMKNVQGDHAPAKRQKMLKKFENLSKKTITEQSVNSQMPLGSVMKFVPRLLTNEQMQLHVNMCLEL
jgi:hypothetical protein